MNKYSLNGEWSLCWQDIGVGSITQLEEMLKEQTISCKVPGDVHMALADAGIIKEPLVDRNSEDCRWLEEKEFWYKKVFSIEESFLQDVTELVFEGLDLTADIWLNGHHIGSHNNAFIEKVIGISDFIKVGENELVVRIDEGVHAVKDKSIELMQYSWNSEQPYRAWMRKPQFVYGWDWTIWLPTCGIWKDVIIHSYQNAAIKDLHIKTGYEGEAISKADKVVLTVEAELDVRKPGKYVLKGQVCGDSRYEKELVIEATNNRQFQTVEGQGIVQTLELVLDKPKLWWPNGSGQPYLYQVQVTLEEGAGNVLQRECRKHGVRSVSIQEAALDEHSKSFTFVINDTPIFAKGANHVPSDCLLGRITDEKNRKLLTAAAEANMNMIRVWGGGVYESEGFMNACDELGIMVWHDFMFACAYYPDHDAEFYEEIHKEATVAVKRLRNHSSLVGWSGNNEIQEMYTSAKNSGKDIPWYGGRLYEELLPELVEKLCPDRIYRPSSPFGGEEPTSYDEGDQHTWHFTHRPAWEHYLDLWRFTDFDFKFLSEFGIIGAMNIESAKKCIREDALYPGSDEWRHHTNTSGNHELVDIFVMKYFDITEDISLQDYILRSQVIQAEMMRHVYDELRSRKFRCSGVLLWTLSDSYGINNWSVIDYYLAKRPIYYYLKRALAPVNISFRGYEVQNFDGMAGYKDYYKGSAKPVEIWVTSDALEMKEVCLEYKVLTFDGKELKSGTSCKVLTANSVEKLLEVDITDMQSELVPEEAILYACIKGEGQIINENRYFFAPYKALKLKSPKIRYSVKMLSDTRAELILASDTFVWMLHVADMEGVEVSDNDFDLLAGMEKTVVIEGENVKDYVPQIYGLNPNIEVEKVIG
ncbi:MAG: hypothetical protein IJX63_05550 [Lachnospiraceae bacterium]|nr:hypothetical protein [Lachnospiraceae bacterium]